MDCHDAARVPNRRPQLRIVPTAPRRPASPAEAAAVVAALERFMRETAPPRAAEEPRASRGCAPHCLEGIDREPTAASRGAT